MSVRDELSCEVAIALLEETGAKNTGAKNTGDLKDVLVLFRSTLSALTAEEVHRRRAKLLGERQSDVFRNISRPAN